tara:strand:+ start:1251 stop:1880 length:630 start_codon:yes stop_codon:yes gene_type:complete
LRLKGLIRMIKLINDDCMNVMKDYDDNHFDLAIVDPPYNLDKSSMQGSGKLKSRVLNQSDTSWDIAPKKEYFDELFRVSKNQIIWGGNYFDLPPTRGIICWDKVQPFPNFSAWEMAWTSFDCVARMFKYDNRRGGKIHPTQKPIELYKWLLSKYAQEEQKILDTHLGSGSIAIACHYFGVDLVGIEIDKEYYDKAKDRIDQLTRQGTLF